MRINIASYGGRNWLLDTARELEKHGHDVKFYSYLPTKRALKFGLKKECNKSYFIVALPFLFLLWITKRSNWSLFVFHYFFDLYLAYATPSCDIFIGQSPMHVYALKKIKKKYNATIILERGTSHVLEQIKALATNPALKGKSPMPQYFIKRDLKGYELADYISVPSEIVKSTFLLNNTPITKLIVNPFGVSLNQFGPTILSKTEVYDLIMVGQWSHRKGCDLLTEVCIKHNYTLIHVGSIIDIDFPNSPNFKHYDAVDQIKLKEYYAKAKVFVLPSREEGLALVQPQAVACGLPIVCSKYTGGRDLKQFIDDDMWIIEMENLNITDLNNCILTALSLSSMQSNERSYSSNIIDKLSWQAYGNRYNVIIENLTNRIK